MVSLNEWSLSFGGRAPDRGGSKMLVEVGYKESNGRTPRASARLWPFGKHPRIFLAKLALTGLA